MKVEYWVFKNMVRHVGDYWDGPWKSLKVATRKFNRVYRNPGRSQDFKVVRVTEEEVRIL